MRQSKYECENVVPVSLTDIGTGTPHQDKEGEKEEEEEGILHQTLSRRIVGVAEEIGYIFFAAWFAAGMIIVKRF